MINFLKTGLRSFKREKLFALVNILSLSLGMFCFIITSLYVRDELTHDKWHSKVDRIFVPSVKVSYSNGETSSILPPFELRAALMAESPGVETVANISFRESDKYQIEDKWYESGDLYYTEQSFFQIFDFGLKWGNQKEAFSEPHSLVLSSEVSKKHFGDKNPIGEVISFEKKGSFKVTGVLNPIPGNSHLQFDMLMTANLNEPPYSWYKNSWSLGLGQNYVLIKENYTIEKLTQDAKAILTTHKNLDYAKNITFDSFGNLYLEGQTYGAETKVFGGQRKYIIIFSLVGSLLLLVACFNHVNLSTARSFARTKDLAIRKVVGASRNRLVLLMVGETAFVSFVSLVVSLIAVELSLDTINAILNKRLSFTFMENPQLLLIPFSALLLVVLISGVYPAIIASSFNLANLLKGVLPKSKASALRKSLLVFQFLICAGLLASALIIRAQAKFMIHMDFGYNVENLYNINLFEGGFAGKYQELRTELERIPQIEGVSGSPLPTRGLTYSFPIEKNGERVPINFIIGAADSDFTDLLEIKILKGRSFVQLEESELKDAILINETGARELGIDDPIGKRITDKYSIVGVMSDFHYSSAKDEIGPLMVTTEHGQIPNLHFKFKAGERATVMAAVEKVWESFETQKPFETKEIATFYSSAYDRENTLLSIFNGLTIMIMVISFLGLFALSTFEGQLKERELGIRKVLGASYLQLIKILSQKFLVLIFIALIASVPICYYLVRNWLDSFPYRIQNVWPQFTMAIGSVVLLSIIILGVHSYLNSRKNPIEVLRNE